MSDDATRAPLARAAAFELRSKTPHEKITILRAETDLCPQALLRILGLVAQHGAIPWEIIAERGNAVQRIAIKIDTMPPQALSVLLAKIETVVTVRWVEASSPAPRRVGPE